MVSHNRQRSPMHSRRCMDLISCDRGSASDFCASYLERARCVVGMALGLALCHVAGRAGVCPIAQRSSYWEPGACVRVSEVHEPLRILCRMTCTRRASHRCVRSCVRRALATEKHLPHDEHTCGFSCGPWGRCPCRRCGCSPVAIA